MSRTSVTKSVPKIDPKTEPIFLNSVFNWRPLPQLILHSPLFRYFWDHLFEPFGSLFESLFGSLFGPLFGPLFGSLFGSLFGPLFWIIFLGRFLDHWSGHFLNYFFGWRCGWLYKRLLPTLWWRGVWHCALTNGYRDGVPNQNQWRPIT